ncbi:hypothetical protein K1719_008651 [Acacia pycnantha]|nr:hypothetical protein K1719_008651 [Acacia pycnantha]
MAMNKGKVDPELFQAQSHLYKFYKHVLNALDSMSLTSALQLNIPGIIHSHGRPITLPDLLSALHIDLSKSCHLYRLMCLLVHSGFCCTTKCDGEEELVLHTFSDEECVKVLKKCREAIASKAKKGKSLEQREKKKNGRSCSWKLVSVTTSITPIFGVRSLIEVYP